MRGIVTRGGFVGTGLAVCGGGTTDIGGDGMRPVRAGGKTWRIGGGLGLTTETGGVTGGAIRGAGLETTRGMLGISLRSGRPEGTPIPTEIPMPPLSALVPPRPKSGEPPRKSPGCGGRLVSTRLVGKLRLIATQSGSCSWVVGW